MDLVMKTLALVESVEEDDSPTGSFHVVLSAPTLDRDDEVVDTRAFDPLPEHISFDIDHDMKVLSTIGSGAPSYEADGKLHVRGTYASTATAQEVRTLVREGHIRTTSVTFMAAKREKDEKGVTHVTRAELLNGTFTPIPSNREAVVLSAKAFEAAVDEKVGARNSASDASKIQGMHDSTVDLGAACPGAAKTARPDGTKAIEVDDDPAALAASVDATLDEAINLLADVDTSGLPEPVAQALALLTAADAAMDELMTVMGVPDPDEEQETADVTAESTAEAADTAAKSAAIPPEILARLAVTENAARLAFGA